MICVIADDLTGAAELGGVATRFGLAVEVQLVLDTTAGADLVCISTDTRSCSAAEATARVARTAELCRAAGLALVFKKVDSVLRGWVAVELAALLQGLDKARALLVPANPSLGRTICDGRYLVDGQPLHETSFALDPEHPVRSSDVLSFAGLQPAGPATANFPPVCLLSPGSRMPAEGILVGQVAFPADVVSWASRTDESTLPAGAADFFAAVLANRGYRLESRSTAAGSLAAPDKALFVCGSTSDASRSFLRRCDEWGVPVLSMPPALLEGSSHDDGWIAQWAAATVQALDNCSRAVVAINQPLRPEPEMPQKLGNWMGAVVRGVLEQRRVDHVFVEGGATATTLVRALGWERMIVQGELGPGVVSVRARGGPGPLLVIKPGSYPWPAEIWHLCRACAAREE